MFEESEQAFAAFANPRAIYHHAAEQNYMAHREIHDAIHHHLNAVYNDTFSVLDLGCGDARYISQTLHATQIKRYTGVDISADALHEARQNLDAAHIKSTLIQGDHTQFSWMVGEQKFRVIIVGFSLHHLPAADKVTFFRACRSHLRKKSGRMLVYDVMRRHHEDRDSYLQRYHENAAEEWPTLNEQALKQLADYISISDYPESLESLTAIAREGGFKRSEVLYVDTSGFHQLIEFV